MEPAYHAHQCTSSVQTRGSKGHTDTRATYGRTPGPPTQKFPHTLTHSHPGTYAGKFPMLTYQPRHTSSHWRSLPLTSTHTDTLTPTIQIVTSMLCPGPGWAPNPARGAPPTYSERVRARVRGCMQRPGQRRQAQLGLQRLRASDLLGGPARGPPAARAPPRSAPARRSRPPPQDLWQQSARCQTSAPRQPPLPAVPAGLRGSFGAPGSANFVLSAVGSPGMGTRSSLIRDLAHTGPGGSHGG